uniref:NADH-ubiquinone oxidoreductase chain 5 n=1 Tax=Cynoglossus zanzibarensis TaxID=526613 RepID=A0A3G0Z5R3_9PLEU|nr:NADH dehydrogenase subunit 5 [Cynoglossus zanzibarensis]AID59756.1 NADH dehydrogenase subunit 5 [Cynoglossus zanzibarensis]
MREQIYEIVTQMMASSFVGLLLILMFGVVGYPALHDQDKFFKANFVANTVKLAFCFSLGPLISFLGADAECVVNSWEWYSLSTFSIGTSFKLDLYSAVFVPVALYVSWCIMQFALWYMKDEPALDQFFKYLLIFLISMITLVTANNLFQLFIGWEGVGIMSFLLISWWHARPDANTAALQAIIYNRAGDIGFFLMMAWTVTNVNSWELNNIFSSLGDCNTTVPAIGMIIAAAGKSAQFGLHPWLPAAMEGPTPVSALLHSSTMVVAGIFLLVRMYPLIAQSSIALTVCLWLGALTTLFTAVCALTQNDIKKIIAFSTSSQLGLMMVTIGLGQPQLAFMHICTHAFFKAMLFMCSGAFIHCLNDEQDIRKMGGMMSLTPFVSSCFILGNLALTGTPFLSGFFSKDAIIEALNTSNVNAWALVLTLIATSFTAVYSMRIVYYVVMGNPRFSAWSPLNETHINLYSALTRLAFGSIAFGYLVTILVPPNITPTMTMTPMTKLAALTVSGLGLILGLELARARHNQPKVLPSLPPHFSTLLGFFPLIIHRLTPKLVLTLGQFISHQLVDQIWLKLVGPEALSKSSMSMAKYNSMIQRGIIKIHLITFLMTLTFVTLLFFFTS